MIKKLGWRKFLLLSCMTFRWKYYPKVSERASDPRSEGQWKRNSNDGALFIFAILVGSAMVFTPMTVIFMDPASVRYSVAVTLIICGTVLLSVPLATLITMMIDIEKHADEFFDRITNG